MSRSLEGYFINDLSLAMFLVYSFSFSSFSHLSIRCLPSTGLCYLVLTRGNSAIKHEIAFTLSGTHGTASSDPQSRVVHDVDVAIDVVGAVVKSNEAIEISFLSAFSFSLVSTAIYRTRTFCCQLFFWPIDWEASKKCRKKRGHSYDAADRKPRPMWKRLTPATL